MSRTEQIEWFDPGEVPEGKSNSPATHKVIVRVQGLDHVVNGFLILDTIDGKPVVLFMDDDGDLIRVCEIIEWAYMPKGSKG